MKHSKIFFIHIPKTAGTTVSNVVSEYGKKVRIFGDRYDFNNNIHYDFLEYDFFSGHFYYSDLKDFFNDRIQFLTILRDPIHRLISSIVHCRRVSEEDVHTEAMMLIRKHSFNYILENHPDIAYYEMYQQSIVLGYTDYFQELNNALNLNIYEMCRSAAIARVIDGRLLAFDIKNIDDFFKHFYGEGVKIHIPRLNASENKENFLFSDEVQFFGSDIFKKIMQTEINFVDAMIRISKKNIYDHKTNYVYDGDNNHENLEVVIDNENNNMMRKFSTMFKNINKLIRD